MEAYLCDLNVEHIDTTWVECLYDIVIGPDQPDPGQLPDDILIMDGELILAWSDWYYNQVSGKHEIHTEIVDMSLTGSGAELGQVEIYMPSSLPPSYGTVVSTHQQPDFPGNYYNEHFFTVEFAEGKLASISRESPEVLEPAEASEPPIDNYPAYFVICTDSIYRMLEEDDEKGTYAWIRESLMFYPSQNDTCYAAFDVNGDGVVLTVADAIYLAQMLKRRHYSPDSFLSS